MSNARSKPEVKKPLPMAIHYVKKTAYMETME